jgi:molybdopterin-guanine dinucleotide biosynthesis protein A
MASTPSVAGLLLTGGASRRLGQDKAVVVIGGHRLCDRAAATLSQVASPVVEVGPGRTSLPATQEDPPGDGPLAALAAGAAALPPGVAVLVLAVDMPSVTAEFLRSIALHPATGCVVPVAGGFRQTLCARYSPEAVALSVELVADGERSMRALLDRVDVVEVAADPDLFADVDTPEDLQALL